VDEKPSQDNISDMAKNFPDDDVLVQFGMRIPRLRSNAGYSQEAFADLCEMDRSYVGGIERGERNFPATPPGITFDDPYSMNTIDLCPVGALTSDDFRFKARAWEMNYAPGIDTSDAMGTNIDVWVRDNEVLRLTPRHKPEVNDYWMTDECRLRYPKYNDRRVSGVKLKGDVPVDWETGYDHAAQLLEAHRGSTLFLGSAHASLESNYALRELAKAYGAGDAFFVPHFIPGRADHLLKTDDVTPNRAGCLLTGLTEIEEDTLLRKLADDGITLVYSLEDEAVAQRLMRDFSGESILHAHHYFDGFDQATVLFGAAMEIEQPGTFVNIHGLPQQTIQARQIKQMTPEDWMAMAKSRLDAGGQLTDRWRHSDHILDVLAGWRISGELIQRAGGAFDFNGYQTLQKHLKGEFSVLEQLRKPPRKQRKESFKMSQFEFAIDLRGKTF